MYISTSISISIITSISISIVLISSSPPLLLSSSPPLFLSSPTDQLDAKVRTATQAIEITNFT